jgi:hypothetical protein
MTVVGVRFAVAGAIVALAGLPAAAVAGPPTPPGSDPAGTRFDAREFARPTSQDRPNAFWFWNGALTEAELERQLHEMRRGGVEEFFIHPRQGLGGEFGVTENAYYLSRDYFDKVEFVLERARSLGMHAWLYDDLNWPSGYAGGRVLGGGEVDGRTVAADPELIARYLSLTPRTVEGPVDEPLPDGSPVAALAARPAGERCDPGGRLDGDSFVELTERVDGGRLRWDAPAGRWCLLFLTEHELTSYHPDLEPEERYVDMLNPAATRKFIDITHETYARRFGRHFGRTIRGIFNDEPGFYNNFPDGRGGAETRGSIPWTTGFRDYLEQNLGYDIVRELPALWYDAGERTTKVRVDYYDALQDRYNEAHTKPLYDWAADHGISLISNPLVEESLGDHKLIEGGDWFEMSRWYQIPGMDLIGGLNVDEITPKLNSSVAHAFNRGRNLAESFGAFGWDLTLEEMKRAIAWEASGGVDLTDNHAFYYSIEGDRRSESPPSEFFQNLFWPHFRTYAETTGRLNQPARGSTPVNRVALLYPTSTIAAEGTPYSNRGFFGNGPELGPVNDSWKSSSVALLQGQLDFDYLSELKLAGDRDVGAPARAEHGRLRLHESAYDVLVWPRTTTMSLEALATVERFVAGGGKLVAVDELPPKEARGRDADLARRIERLFSRPGAVFLQTRERLAETVRELARPDVVLAPAEPAVRVRHVARRDEDAFLLVNTAGERVETEASLARRGVPELWWPETGETGAAVEYREDRGRTVVPLTLEPYESVWVVFRSHRRDALHVTAASATVESLRGRRARVVVDTPGEHYVVAEDHGAGFAVDDPLEPIALGGEWDVALGDAAPVSRPLGSWTALDRLHSGSARYTKRFDVPAAFLQRDRRILLELGAVDEIAEIRLNGRDAGARVWEPYRLDVTDRLRAGENTLEVTVTNTQANAFEGRALSSGLIGPVRLRPQRVVDVELDRGAIPTSLAATVEPTDASVLPGADQPFRVRLEGIAPDRIAGTLRATVPDGWTAEPAEQPFALDSDGTPVSAELAVTVHVPDGTPDGTYDVTFTAGSATATATVRVTSALAAWEFETDGDAEGWTAANQLDPFTVAGGALTTRSTGGDPYMIQSRPLAIDADGSLTVEIVMATSAGGEGQVFFTTQASPGFSEDKSATFSVTAGAARTYRVPLPPQSSPVAGLRIDPLRSAADIRIESIRVLP